MKGSGLTLRRGLFFCPKPFQGAVWQLYETCAIFLPASLPQDSHPKITFMKSISFSRTKGRCFTTLYFASEPDLIEVTDAILKSAKWTDETAGEWELMISGLKGGYCTCYTDKITADTLMAIRDYTRIFRHAEELARHAVGPWSWWFGNSYFRRAATLRYIDIARSGLKALT